MGGVREGMGPDLARGRATRAIVDLTALEGNVRALKGLLGGGVALMAVVKADGYGHGAVEVGKAALAAGAAALGVATVGEGAVLRQAGLTAPILVLGAIDLAEAGRALRLVLDLTVGTEELLDAVAEAARGAATQRPAAVHVKVDSGMRRYGARPDLAIALGRRVAADPALCLAGLSTHFAAADEADERPTVGQVAVFDRVAADLEAVGVRPECLHVANSAASLRSGRYHYGMVRVGIALYGLPSSVGGSLPPGARPVLTVRSRVTRVVELDPGDGVGYGLSHRARESGRAALVPIGYGDGYRRALSGRAWMGVGGERAPLLGRVSMDQTVVGLRRGGSARVGDEVVVFGGEPGEAAPSANEVAEMLATIPYEVVTALAPRVPRVYVRRGNVGGACEEVEVVQG